MGAGKWRDYYSDSLADANVVVMRDSDSVGGTHAKQVADSLFGKTKSLKLLPPFNGVMDVSEWLDKGNNLTELETLVGRIPYYSPNVYTYKKGDKSYLERGQKGTNCDDPLSVKGTKGDKGDTEEQSRSFTAEDIREWVIETDGRYFYSDEIDQDYRIIDPKDKDYRKKVLQRMRENGELEKHPKINRQFRYVNPEAEKINIFNSTNPEIPIKFPFGIEDYVKIYPSNLIVVAGSPDAGKTALLLNIVAMNVNNFNIVYFSSEMEGGELTNRLGEFQNVNPQDWLKVDWRERAINFSDVIKPDWINIIDYMELTTDLYLVADYLAAIQRKLKNGIAIVALQKKRGQELGRGAEFSLEKPRLYLSMESGEIKIVKAKNWRRKDVNPNGMVSKFKIVNGCDFRIYQHFLHPDF
jgi:hypothetical protein